MYHKGVLKSFKSFNSAYSWQGWKGSDVIYPSMYLPNENHTYGYIT